MATLRELKKRLKSTETTGQLAGAMRTVATAKYSKVSAVLGAYSRYAEAISPLGTGAAPDREDKPGVKAVVLLSGNRGLCGGFHHELFNFLAEEMKAAEGIKIIPCGRMAAEHCREKKLPVLEVFTVGDVPSFEDAKRLSEYLAGLYASGEAESIDFVYQRFVNMLKQIPERKRFLPAEAGGMNEEELLFFPDRETVEKELAPLSRAAECYSLLLSSASGAQAATMMAMRSAYDNAQASSKRLNTQINRLRQAAVTMSVLETSSDIRNN